MEHNTFRHYVYAIFSDTLMVFLALLVIPILILPFFNLSQTQALILEAVDVVIYAAFFLEFALKVGVEERKVDYMKANSLNSAISLIIILSPLFGFFTAYFLGAPLLRLVSASRIFRLGAAVGKAETSFRKVSFKSYGIVLIIVAAGFVASFFRPTVPYSEIDTQWLTIFIPVVGGIYAIVAAFVMFHVWNEFNALSDKMRKEAVSLRNVYLLSLRTKQKGFIKKLRDGIIDYTKSVIETYWKDMAKMEENENKFVHLFRTIDELKVKNAKDAVLLDNIDEELRTASENRSDIISLAYSTTPNVLWALMVYLSVMLVFCFMILTFHSQLLATLVITMMAAAVALITLVIYDMDYPFEAGFWMITPQPYFDLEGHIKRSED